MSKPSVPSFSWDVRLQGYLERAIEGDREAFGEIYRAMYPAVAKYLYYKTGGSDGVEDLANEVFLGAWRALPGYKGGYFPGLVFRIARNQAVGRLRKTASDRRRVASNLHEGNHPLFDPTEDVDRLDEHLALHRMLTRLKTEQRDVVVMKHLLGMSNAEVAASLSINENAVNARHNRALKTLGRLLEAEGVVR